MTKFKQKYAFLFITAFLVSSLCSCMFILTTTGNGNIITEDFSNRDFTKICLHSAIEAEIIQGESWSISMTMDENLFSLLDIDQSGDELTIRFQPMRSIHFSVDPKCRITMPALALVDLSGACSASLSFSDLSSLNLKLSGASEVSGSLFASSLNMDLSGASSCDLSGTLVSGNWELSGASKANCSNLVLSDLYLEGSGASVFYVDSRNTIEGKLSGASDLHYKGSPVINVGTSGASSISQI